MAIHDFFEASAVDVKGLGDWLDALPQAERVAAVRELSGEEQAALFEAAQGARPLTMADFVPEGTPPLREVIHEGKNSLPLFSSFQKRFCRPQPPAAELWGYNEQPMKWATGPGYFKVREIDGGQVLIDYFDVPATKPEGWPKIVPNSARLSRFVYFHTQDTMRGVSRHVSIGRAAREGKWMDNWFALCRSEG
jgi:hypothetical protein